MESISLHEAERGIQQRIDYGMRLAEQNSLVLYTPSARDSKKGFEEITMGDMAESMATLDDKRIAWTAIMLENTRQLFEAMDESTFMNNIGDFHKFAFPMVRAIFPNLIAMDLVSVQPMMSPTSQVFYLRFVYNATKGTAIAGTDIFENPNAYYSSERVDEENVGAAGVAAHAGNLSYRPVRAGTVTFTDGTQIVSDDGQGSLTGDINGAQPHTINYATGAFDFDFAAVSADVVVCTYEYNMEGNSDLPELDMVIHSSPVTARQRKIKAQWGVEAMHDLNILHGVDGETELTSAIANEIKFGLDREVILDLMSMAVQGSAHNVTYWPKTTPAGISITEHKLSMMDMFVAASNVIYERTQRAEADWLVAGVGVCNYVETLPQFKREGRAAGNRGVYYLGMLGDWKVYKNSYMTRDNWLMGHTGTSMYETGYIYAPYVPIYTTPTVQLDDFLVKKGVASRYGKKTIDEKFYVQGSLAA